MAADARDTASEETVSAAQAEAAGAEDRNAHTCGRHCGTAYHPDALTVRLIEQYEADHPTRRSAR